MAEIIPLVDNSDNIIGYKARNEINHETDIYRVSSIWIMNDKNELLLGQRSFGKKIYPGAWDVAVSGTVERGETYVETAERETKEEIGIVEKLTIGPKVRIEGKYNMFIQWFFLKTNKLAEDFEFQKTELVQVKWFSRDVILEMIKNEPQNFMADGRDMLRWIELFWK